MRSFTQLAVLALPIFSTAILAAPSSPTKQSDSIYASAQEAFQDLLNALPEESLQAALSSLQGFKDGVFESHHRGVEQVHNDNPALATKLIVAAVHDLKKRQATPSATNNTNTNNEPPASASSTPVVVEPSSQPPVVQSSATPAPPPSSTAQPPPSSTERAVVVPVDITTTDSKGSTIVSTSTLLSQATASVPVTLIQTNTRGQTITTIQTRPAIIATTTDSAGRTITTTSAARLQPTAGEVLTETDAKGSVFLTTVTPGGGKVSSVKLVTTTGDNGQTGVYTTYEYVDPVPSPTSGGVETRTGKPSLQSNGAVSDGVKFGWAVAGGLLAVFA